MDLALRFKSGGRFGGFVCVYAASTSFIDNPSNSA